MNFLVTNDDGIFAPGVEALAGLLAHFGDVTVVCPETERTAYSHKISLHHPINIREVKFEGGIKAYAIDGSPADCVKLGLELMMDEKPDIVFSGINIGPNIGRDSYYSGTIAATQEAALNHIPALAVSLDHFAADAVKFEYVNKLLYELLNVILKRKFPKNTILNINLPYTTREECKGVQVVPIDMTISRYQFNRLEDTLSRSYFWLKDIYQSVDAEEGSDYYYLKNGYITISPIEIRQTSKQKINQLSTWFKKRKKAGEK